MSSEAPLVDTIPASNATVIATKTVFVTVHPTSQPSLIYTPTTPFPTFLSTALPAPTAAIHPNGSTTDAAITELPYQVHTGGVSHPNNEQITTIWVAAVMLLCIMIGWNMVIIRSLLYPWKMLTNLIHECSHVFVAILTGANVYSINIDPDKGPISSMTGGQPFIILSAGYLGSISIGSSLIMSAFDTSASKVASLIIFPLFIICFWFGRTWARIRVLGCIGLSIGFWFIEDAYYLPFYILFIGVMNAFYVIWDTLDDLLFRKENECDAALFARMSAPTIHAWVLIWLFLTLAFVALGVVGGLHFFDRSAQAQAAAQRTFLPT